jgi:hypothetical protein
MRERGKIEIEREKKMRKEEDMYGERKDDYVYLLREREKERDRDRER